jgi:SNF2 family DNA or RNA helicase
LDLPKKKEMLLFCPLVPKQKALYDASVRGIKSLREFLVNKMDEEKAKVEESSVAGSTANVSETVNGSEMSVENNEPQQQLGMFSYQ